MFEADLRLFKADMAEVDVEAIDQDTVRSWCEAHGIAQSIANLRILSDILEDMMRGL